VADTTRRLFFDIFTRDRNTKRTLEGIADATEDAGDEFKAMARDAAKLDGEIGDLEKEIAKLKLAMAGLSGDAFKDMDRQLRGLESTLKRKINVKKVFGDAGAEGAEKLALSLSQRIGPLMARVPVSPQIIAAVAAASPVVLSTIGAAISGGVALGVAGIGAKIAAQDERVKAAGSRLGSILSAGMKEEADVFVEPLLANLDRAEAKFTELRPVIRDAFSVGASNLDNLLAGIIDGSDELVRDLADINRNAEPVVNVLSRRIPSAAAAATGALKRLSSESEHNAKTLDVLFAGLEASLGLTAYTLDLVNKAGKFTQTGILIDWLGKSDRAAAAAAESQRQLDASIDAARQSIADQEAALTRQVQALKESEQASMDARLASLDYKDTLAGLKEQVKDHGRSLDENTVKGRSNVRYLLEATGAATRAGDAAEAWAAANGASASAAAAAGAMVRRTWIADLQAAAVKAGFSRSEVNRLVAAARAADGTRIRMYFDQQIRTFGRPIAPIPGRGFQGFSEGGEVPGPPVRQDIVPALLMPKEGVLTVDGMRRIGGKAGLDAINKGRAPVGSGPAGTAIGGMQTVRIVIDGTGVLTGLRKEIFVRGGDVQQVLGQ
jgi:hypothetical protein